MNQQQWKQIEAIIDHVLDLPRDKRDEYFEKMIDDPVKKQAKLLLNNIRKAEREEFLEK